MYIALFTACCHGFNYKKELRFVLKKACLKYNAGKAKCMINVLKYMPHLGSGKKKNHEEGLEILIFLYSLNFTNITLLFKGSNP